MKVTIFHKEHEWGYEYSPVVNMDKCEKVADVEVATDNEMEALETAYYLTNNIDESWTNMSRRSNIVSTHLENARSTSVGDVAVVNGKTFVVAPCGFEKAVMA
jgi:hypothetical protein